MLCTEIIAVCSQIHTKHINTLCGQNVELLIVKPGGIYCDNRDLKGSVLTPSDSIFRQNIEKDADSTTSTVRSRLSSPRAKLFRFNVNKL